MERSSRQRATRRRSPPDSVADLGVARREAQGVHRDLEGPLEVPGAGGVDPVLQLGLLGEQLVEVGIGLAHRGADLVEAVEERLARRRRRRRCRATSLSGSSCGSWARKPTREARREPGLAAEAVVLPGHDPQQRRLARAVRPDDPDLGSRVEGQVDAAQHLAVGRVETAKVAHRVDELRCHAVQCGVTRGCVRPNPRRRPQKRSPGL